MTVGIQNPSSTEKDLESSNWNPEYMAWNPESKTVLDFLRLRFLILFLLYLFLLHVFDRNPCKLARKLSTL